MFLLDSAGPEIEHRRPGTGGLAGAEQRDVGGIRQACRSQGGDEGKGPPGGPGREDDAAHQGGEGGRKQTGQGRTRAQLGTC